MVAPIWRLGSRWWLASWWLVVVGASAFLVAVPVRAQSLGGGAGVLGLLQETPGRGAVVADASVDRFLRSFERAAVANDADQRSELYAESIDRYFLKTNVTREFVYRDLLDWLSRGRLITGFRLTVLSSEGGGGQTGAQGNLQDRTLVVRKEASWIDGGSMRVLVTRSQFILRRIGSDWKIVSERDYKPER